MEVLMLRFDAPLMSFGGTLVDQLNPTDPLPYRAMLAGLVANALGLERSDTDAHERLQRRIHYAARADRAGSVIVDYQTVDFSDRGTMHQGLGWTTRGVLEERKGGGASDGTHIRYRSYLADGIITVAFALDPVQEAPMLAEVAQALRQPARPIFLGRKCCVPSGPVLLGIRAAESLRAALEEEPRAPRLGQRGLERSEQGPLLATWRQDAGTDAQLSQPWPRVEDRDWANSIHVGRRIYSQGAVNPPWDEPSATAEKSEAS